MYGVMCAHHWVSSPEEDSHLSFISTVVTKCPDQKQLREEWVYFSSWFQFQSKSVGKSRSRLEAAGHTHSQEHREDECIHACLYSASSLHVCSLGPNARELCCLQ